MHNWMGNDYQIEDFMLIGEISNEFWNGDFVARTLQD